MEEVSPPTLFHSCCNYSMGHIYFLSNSEIRFFSPQCVRGDPTVRYFDYKDINCLGGKDKCSNFIFRILCYTCCIISTVQYALSRSDNIVAT